MSTNTGIESHTAAVSPPPIARLNSDLLWLIFMKTTESSLTDIPLVTTRFSSQVCREWRNLLLSLPVVWGRLVHLGSIFACHDEWATTVIERTGIAPLWVYGTITWQAQDKALALLRQFWARIQRLSVQVDNCLLYGDMDATSASYGQGIMQAWDVFMNPSPLLKEFTVYAGDYYGGVFDIRLQNSRPITLFSNDAPSLQEFSHFGMAIEPNSRWLSNLRSLTLSHPFKFSQIYTILSSIRNIESLNIVGTSTAEDLSSNLYSEFPAHNLPKLNELKLSGDYTIISPLIACITPQDGCTLHLTLDTAKRWIFTPSNITVADREHMEVIQRKATETLQRYLLAHRPTELIIDCQNDHFHLNHTVGQDPEFTINGAFNEESGPRIIEQISRHGYLSTVTKLTLHLDVASTYLSSLSKLPSALISLSELETSEDTLKYLVNNDARCVFPSLRVLKLTRLCPAKSHVHYLWDFLEQQLDGGSPVTVLDLTHLPHSQVYNIQYLDSIVVLTKMRWILPHRKPMLYEHGSGEPTGFRSKHTFQFYQDVQRVDIDEEAEVFFRHYDQIHH